MENHGVPVRVVEGGEVAHARIPCLGDELHALGFELEGPFHTWVATAGLWRYDDDGGDGSGPYGVNGAPFSQVVDDHGTDKISKICISTGYSAGTNLSALLRSWELNAKDYAFGL